MKLNLHLKLFAFRLGFSRAIVNDEHQRRFGFKILFASIYYNLFVDC